MSGRGRRESRRNARWSGVLVAALVACVLAFAVGSPGVLLVALVPLGYAAYGSLNRTPDPTLAVERDVDDRRPRPGQDVTVTLTVENVGDHVATDVRVADDPPPGVPLDGTPEAAVSLRPGETTTVTYDCNVPRGTFEWGDVRVRSRNAAGTAVAAEELSPEGVDELTCQTLLDAVPLRDRTIQYVGRAPTDSGGSGVEFHSTRAYRRGDPVGRIDWARYARTGDLTTVQMREERALTVVFLVDDRPRAQRSHPDYGPDTLDLAVYAVSQAFPTLVEENHRVGVATAVAVRDGDPGGYVSPGSGPAVEAATEDALDDLRADGAGDAAKTGEAVATDLAARLPPGAQVVCCSPLVDGFATGVARSLERHDHAVTVLSPDVRPDDPSLAARLAATRRRTRVRALERRGVPVVDWDLDDPLATALGAVFETGGRVL